MIVNVGYSKLFEMLWLIYDRHYSGHVEFIFASHVGLLGLLEWKVLYSTMDLEETWSWWLLGQSGSREML